MSTLPRIFKARVAETPDRRAYSAFERGAWRDHTWRDFDAQARALGLGIVELGVARGDAVAILGRTCREWVVTDVGALCIGAVTVGLYPTLAPEGIGSMHYVIDHSRAKVVVVEGAEMFRAKVAPILAQLGRVTHFVLWQGADEVRALDPRIASMDDVCARGEAAHARNPSAWDNACLAASPDDLALLIYTSGTTGQPKGAMITHENVAEMTVNLERLHPRPEDGGSTVSFLPLAHAAERCLGLYGRIQAGMATHFARSLETILEDVGTAKPTRFGSVPRIFEKAYGRIMGEIAKLDAPMQEMAKAAIAAAVRASAMKRRGEEPDAQTKMMAAAFDARIGAAVRERFGGRCEWFATGAAPTAVEILELFDACGIPTYEIYGLTETTGVLTSNRLGAHKYGTVGKPIGGVEIRIADDGEILARGKNIFRGYFDDPEATRECLKDGWFHTGDIGRIDDEGFLLITDRKKNILITAGGKNITPSNIENAVKNDPLVSQCHLHADRRPYPVALIALDPERLAAFAAERGLAGRTPAELAGNPVVTAAVQAAIDRVNAGFAQYEQIRKFAVLPRELTVEGGELTPTLKVKRKVVDTRYADLLDALYAGAASRD